MEKGYKILGNYIRVVDERNKNLAVTKLLGVSISKKFIPSIANIVGTDLSNYKIVRTGQFAYGPVTSRNGEKISIAYLDEEDCIISSSYTVFEVENKEELDPEYLMLWFSRPEFDRYARYANEVLDDVAEQLAQLLSELKTEKNSFKNMGIDYEEKAFYDILKAVSKKFEFEYPDDKMIELSKRIKLIVDDKSRYTDWSARDDIKANLQVDLILLLDEFGYPPVTIDDVYKEVLEQAENFKKYAQ